jgi:hypothetical protein
MWCSPQFGVLSSPASHPNALDLNGSDATTLISTRSHLGHSNNRCSKPVGPDDTRSSSIRVWQWRQRGRSIAARNGWDEVMVLPCMAAGAFQNSPSPGRCRSRPVMPARLTRPVIPVRSILLILQKLINRCAFQNSGRLLVSIQRGRIPTEWLQRRAWGLRCAGAICGERCRDGQRRSAASRSHSAWRRCSLLLT